MRCAEMNTLTQCTKDSLRADLLVIPQTNSFENIDCMQMLKKCPPKYFDLAIVDPQYGIGASQPSIKPNTVKQRNGKRLYVTSNKHPQKDWDLTKMPLEYFEELKRVSKNQIIWGENYYGIFAGGRIVWDKLNGESDQFGCEIAYCSINDRTDIVYYMWSGMFQGVYCGKDLRRAWKQQGNKQLNEERIHPTQKPIKLMKRIVLGSTNEGDLVLDPFMGSGTTGVACIQLNRNFIGFEISPDYFAMAQKRINEAQAQKKLGD